MNSMYKCKKDLLIGRELAFKKGESYVADFLNSKIYGCNDTPYSIGEVVASLGTLNSFDDYFEYIYEEKMNDAVNHPNHYTWLKDKCGIEVIDITRHLDFDLGNALKYILRAGKKEDAIQDLKKAIWYIQDKIKMLENDK